MYQTIKVELTTQNILSGQTNPIPVLPSLPSNQAYRVLDFFVDNQSGSQAFDADTFLELRSLGASHVTAAPVSNGGFVSGIVNGNGSNQIVPGAGIYLSANQDSVNGDGTATAYITYHVIDL